MSFESAASFAAPLQQTRSLQHQVAQGGVNLLTLRQGFGEVPFDHAIGRRPQGFDTHILMAEQPFDPARKIGAETRGESARGTRRDIAERFQAGAIQGEKSFIATFQRRQRQVADSGFFFSRAENATRRKTRQGAGAIRRSRQRDACAKTERSHVLRQSFDKTGFAAKQMGATGDVENQAMRFVQRRQRRIALAARRQARQDLRIRRTVRLGCDEFRQAGARIGQRQAGRKPLAKGSGGQRIKPLRAALLFNQGEGRLVIRRVAPSPGQPQPLRRQEGQPQGEIASR